MVRLLDSLELARNDPQREVHLALEISRLFDQVSGGALDEDTQIQVEQMEDDSALATIIRYLEDWYSDQDYKAAREALSLFDDAITDTVQNGWFSVAAVYYSRLILLKLGLAGHDSTDELSECLEFVLSEYEEISHFFD